jgi:hypothetical protein
MKMNREPMPLEIGRVSNTLRLSTRSTAEDD